MNNKWAKLFKQFEVNGYKPNDIQRIVMVYEMYKENDTMLKKMFEAEKNESTNPQK